MKNYLETRHGITPFEKIDYIHKCDDGEVRVFNFAEHEQEIHVSLLGNDAVVFLNDYREWRELLIAKLTKGS